MIMYQLFCCKRSFFLSLYLKSILFKETYKADGDCEDVPILAGNVCSATGTMREVQKSR